MKSTEVLSLNLQFKLTVNRWGSPPYGGETFVCASMNRGTGFRK